METLFRFALLVPPVLPTDSEEKKQPAIDLTQVSTLQAQLAAAASTSEGQTAIVKAYRDFVASKGYLGSPPDNPFYDALRQFDDALNKLPPDSISTDKVETIIKDVFGKSSSDLSKDATFQTTLSRLRDSILAIKGLPEEHWRDIEGLSQQLRDMELIVSCAQGKLPGSDFTAFRTRGMLFPRPAQLKSFISDSDWSRGNSDAEAKQRQADMDRLATLHSQFQDLGQAKDTLLKVPAKYLAVTRPTALAAIIPSEKDSHLARLNQTIDYRFKLADANLNQFKVHGLENTHPTIPITVPPITRSPLFGGTTQPEEQPHETLRLQTLATGQDNTQGLLALSSVAKDLLSPFNVLGSSGVSAFNPHTSPAGLMKPEVKEVLDETTQRVLKDRGRDLTNTPFHLVANELHQQQLSTALEIRNLTAQLEPSESSLIKIGDTHVLTQPGLSTGLLSSLYEKLKPTLQLPWPLLGNPTSHGNIAPAGLAKLIIVKQQLIRYEGGDVAHIENVLKNEQMDREFTTTERTETTTTSESESSSSKSNALETTDRYDLSTETNKQIKEAQSFKAAASISAHGPCVSASASVDYNTSSSTDTSTKTAAHFAQDQTRKASETITQRAMKRITTVVTSESVDKNVFQIDNRGASGHISGVYQWVNKVYLAQMYDYGARMMYEVMCPEPASPLISRMSSTYNNKIKTLVKPPALDVVAERIHVSDWDDLALKYGVTDIEPPLSPVKTVTHSFRTSMTPPTGPAPYYTDTVELDIPDGYEPYNSQVNFGLTFLGSDWYLYVLIGDGVYTAKSGQDNYAGAVDQLSVVDGKLQMSCLTWSCAASIIHVTVWLRPSATGIQNWKQRNWAKLYNAHKAAESEYENKLAELQLQAGISFQGNNPDTNLEVMRTELKRSAISIFTEQSFRSFGAVSNSGGDVNINYRLAKEQGYYVSFFEQAFEWENMTWVTYPYYWSRRSTWAQRLGFNDPDPLFDDFLKSGFARLQIPARLGFENAIDHFMKTGQPWGGGKLPTVSDALYLPISTEVANRQQKPGTEIAIGDPWEIKLPTSLVKLRADDQLPAWTEIVEAGEKVWVEKTPVVPQLTPSASPGSSQGH